ncbi:MAG: NAD(P)/FAD-dependent oxidoreductase [Dictyoglomaceae bacterium]
MQKEVDVVVIGGGPAGLASAKGAGSKNTQVLILERGEELGGILQQCIHPGFGLLYFKEELTGPEYAQKWIEEIENMKNIEVWTKTMVLEVYPDKRVLAVNEKGLWEIKAKAVIFAMGCRERTQGNLAIPGTRPAGIFTAGTAQRLVNIEGYLPGEKILILGSGDIGLIMARRLKWEGAEVTGVVEKLPYPGGLTRNLVQCLEDYNIPLYLNHTVVEIKGEKRVEGVYVAPLDEKGDPILSEKKFFPCDTLLLSVGLIPENELSEMAEIPLDKRTGGPFVDQFLMTEKEGFFACGNVLLVNDLVDYVSSQGLLAGENAGRFINREISREKRIPVNINGNLRLVVPQYISYPLILPEITFYFRVLNPHEKSILYLKDGGKTLKIWKYPIVRPAEMLVVKIKSLLLENAENINFSLEEER